MKEQDAKLERELADMHEKARKGTAQADAGELIPAKEVLDELRRWHDATAGEEDNGRNELIEDLARLIPESCEWGKRPGTRRRFSLHSGRVASFSKQSDLYILGINPGGEDPTDTLDTSLDSRVKEVLCNKKDDWAALKDDNVGERADASL